MIESFLTIVPTYRTPEFHFSLFSKDVVEQLAEHVDRGESIVVLGPTGIGKRFVLANIRKHIEAKAWVPIRLDCDHSFIDLESQIQAIILKQLPPRQDDSYDHEKIGEVHWKEHIRNRLARGAPTRYIVFVSNVDALPTNSARRLLQDLRGLSEVGVGAKSKLSVVLSGAFDLAPLVFGINSEVYIHNQYVIQGFQKDILAECFRENASVCGIDVCEECTPILF